MQRRSIIWIIAVVVCLLGGWCVWHWFAASSVPGQDAAVQAATGPTGTPPTLVATAPNAGTNKAAAYHRSPAEYRLTNTTEPLERMIESDTAILLENARVDTAVPATLPIPEHLRSHGEPGAYIVQAHGLADAEFRALLEQSGATLVSYIPNNAWLVQATSVEAQWLAAQTRVQSTLAFEPFFKLKSTLLPFAVEQTPLPAGAYLNVVMFEGGQAQTADALRGLGARILSETWSPFGPVALVQPRPESLAEIASLPGVQLVERAMPRVEVNDLARVKMGVSTDTLVTNNYFGLTGAGVTVAVADSGVDSAHPDLAGRVTLDTPAAGVDTVGHGTHVAGIIAGSGASSLSSPLAGVPGSVDGADFRGKAPAASLYAIRLNYTPTNGLDTDAYAQQQVAQTNALIYNGSWGYLSDSDYTIASASYDAAVRDSLPFAPGSQPVTYVFSAGNSGGGNDSGQSGRADSITAPASGKNVITVGALEQLRNITNEVYYPPDTNAAPVWEAETDSDSEVAGYSSRGNVGVGVEGIYGRFKPDVVAPGSWVISAQSKDWDQVSYYSITNTSSSGFDELLLPVDGFDVYSYLAPENAIEVRLVATAVNPVVDLPIYVRVGEPPTTNDFVGFNQVTIPPDLALTPFDTYFYAIGNPTNVAVEYNVSAITTSTNDLENYYKVLKELNDALGPDYRYETGTSMSAPAVSGMLALMHEYYMKNMGVTNSPALMKALLINGARVASSLYDLQVQNTINYQGWGVASLPTSLPPTTNGINTNAASSFVFYDQNPDDALATGQSRTRTVTLGTSGAGRTLRFTLVWTDPAGNPAAGVKLVNDLDLVVTNLNTGDVYIGNDFGIGSGFTSILDTNAPASPDHINNVENVFVADPTNATFSVTVIGHRVNVNAVTAHPDNVVQDYALVISSGSGEVTDSFTVVDAPTVNGQGDNLTVLTNTISPTPLLNQTVGASTPLIAALNGITNQWHFYAATNYGTNANFTNAAFFTFLPPTLSVPRMGPWSLLSDQISRPEADIDLYVSTEAGLTNLDPAVLTDPLNTWRSVGRGGTEIITLSNAVVGQVYYIGVKSEDQMGGQYGFFTIFSDKPFSERDAEGNQIIYGFPAPVVIPDGNNEKPGAALMFGIATLPDKIRKVTVTNTITHDNMGDLFGNLSHNNDFVVLNNHTFGNGNLTQVFVYDDDGGGADSKQPDGPGTLQNFVTKDATGLWLLTMLDDSEDHTGQIDNLTIKVEPQQIQDEGDRLLIAPNTFGYTFVEVPVEATNLTVTVSNLSPNPQPVEVYLRRDDLPTLTLYDKKATINPPGGSISINKNDIPPLQAGIYYIGVYNPNAIEQEVLVKATIDLDLSSVVPTVFTASNSIPLLDDAVTNSYLVVTNDETIGRVEVGVRLNHPRVSDMALTLVSPKGTRVLLFENRGALDPNGLGADITATNSVDLVSPEGTGTNAYSTNLFVPVAPGTIRITYDFGSEISDLLTIYQGGSQIYSNVLLGASYFDLDYPGTDTNLVFFVNEGGGTNENTVWKFSVTFPPLGYLHATFTEDTNKVSNPESLLKFVTPPFTQPNPDFVLTNQYTNGIYYLPEESLEKLKAEDTKGTWTLELWDSRAGEPAPLPVPELLEWNLSFIFVQKSPPFIVLDPYVAITSTVPANSFEYLIVDVPAWATAATNYLLSATDPVFVWFNQDGAPSGAVPPDTLFFGGPATNGTLTLTTNGTPPLIPGQRYYIGIQNTNLVSVTYSYQVDFDITWLTNGIPYTAVSTSNGIPRYFAYDVSTNATAVAFELFGMDGNLNLVARQGAPLPTLFDNDYYSINPGLNDESIVVFTNSSPVALRPGVWYLGVLNGSVNAVNYSIQATEFTNAFPDIISLTNGIPYANTSASQPGTAQYYHYRVSTNAARVQFETFGSTGDYTLVASRGLPLPGLFSYDYRSANPGTNDEVIVVLTNSTPVNLTSGDWFLAVVKISGGPADYNVMATEWPTTAFPPQIISSGVNGTDYCITWASLPGVHYYVQGKANLVSPIWDTISPTITAFDYTTEHCIPLPTPYTVFRVVEGVVVSPSPPLPTVITGLNVSPGVVTMTWFGPLGASFQVEFTDTLIPLNWQPAGPPVTSVNEVFSYTDDGTFTGSPPTGSRYYRVIQLP